MDYNQGIESVLDGEAILFCGAGFNIGAKNLRGTSFKSGAALSAYLSRLTGSPLDSFLEDAAEEFANKFGEDKLIEELQQEFLVKEISKSHQIVAQPPWKRIYTTNYDNVLETAYSKVSRKLIPVTLSQNINSLPNKNTICVHLNGFVPNIDRDNIWSEVKLTDTSYLTASISQSPWVNMFRQDISIARAVFFVGYSAYDLDIRRILFETPNLKEKCFFIIGKNPKAVTERKISRFGKVLKKDTDSFASVLDKKSKQYSPPNEKPFLGYCIERFVIPQTYNPPTDQSIFDLVMFGKSNIGNVWNSINTKEKYFCEREDTENVIGFISKGKRVITIHSELGNGKSLFLEGVKCRAVEKGYNVYVVVNQHFDIISEIDQITRSNEKILLIVDDYPDYFDAIKYFHQTANDTSACILSARSSAHDVFIDSLYNVFDPSDIPEISIDKLSSNEVVWLRELLDEYGLWGDQASWPNNRKENFIKQLCKNEFHAVLLKLFESPQIIEKFDLLLSQIINKKDYYEIIIGILSLSVINYRPNLDILIDIWGDKVLGSQFRRNPVIQQIIDFDMGIIKIKSSVAAEFILRKIANAEVVVNVLTKMVRSFEKASAINKSYQNILSALVRFRNLQYILPDKHKRPACIKYYESIKNLYRFNKYPLFWFQYAIACLVFEEFDRAKRYFKTAYSLAKKMDFNTFQIDNHFARFNLLYAINKNKKSECMKYFRKARIIINRQAKDERLHYSYRVATTYADFYDKFEPIFTLEDKKEIGRAANYLLLRIENLPSNRKKKIYIYQCKEAMEHIVQCVSQESADEEKSNK